MVDVVWHLHHWGTKLKQLYDLKSFLKKNHLGKIRLGPPKLVTYEFASDPPPFSLIRHFFPQIRRFFWELVGPGPKVATGGWGGDGLGRPLVPPLLTVKSSFCLVLLNYKRSEFFYWCKLSLLILSCILILSSHHRMAINCCSAQITASAAQWVRSSLSEKKGENLMTLTLLMINVTLFYISVCFWSISIN